MRQLSNALLRFKPNTGGLSSGWEEYQYMDTYTQPVSGSSDVGTSWSGSSLWNTVADLASTYIKTDAQKKLAQTLAKTQSQAGSTVSVDPTGAVVKTTYQPLTLPESGADVLALLKNPLVLIAGGFIAYKLIKKKKG